MTRLEELQNVLHEANNLKMNVEARQREREQELMAKMREQLDYIFGQEWRIAVDAVNKASAEYTIERNKVNEQKSLESLPYPVGTKLFEWETKQWTNEFRKTNRVAVLEIYKQGDALPVNTRWSRPEVGDMVLRILKKDGTVGSKVEVFRDYLKSWWLPEGVVKTK